MEGKDVFKYSLNVTWRLPKFTKTLPAKTSVKRSSKGEATFVAWTIISKVRQTVVILALTIVKGINCEYISQRSMHQQIICKKQKIHL